jgi:hypothetical protein
LLYQPPREQLEVRNIAYLNHYDGSFPLFYVGRSVVGITRLAMKIEGYPSIDSYLGEAQCPARGVRG